MTIKNPILRYLASFAVLVMLLAALVIFLFGIGSLVESRYAQEYPILYESTGSSFIDSMVYAIPPLLILTVIGVCFALLLRATLWIENRLFGPPVEDVEAAEMIRGG